MSEIEASREAAVSEAMSRLPPRVREIVREEAAAAQIWVSVEADLYNILYRKFARNRDKLSKARHAIWWRCRQEIQIGGKPVSYPTIGKWFATDHTTVVKAVRNFVDDHVTTWSDAKRRLYEAQRLAHNAEAAKVYDNIKSYAA